MSWADAPDVKWNKQIAYLASTVGVSFNSMLESVVEELKRNPDFDIK